MSRGKVAGPFAGAYGSFTVDLGDATITPGATTLTYRRRVPGNLRVQQVDLYVRASSGGASRPTLQITDATNNLFSEAVSAEVATTVEVTPTSSPSLVAAERDFAKDDVMTFIFTFVATEAVNGLGAVVHYFTKDHVVSTGSQPDAND